MQIIINNVKYEEDILSRRCAMCWPISVRRNEPITPNRRPFVNLCSTGYQSNSGSHTRLQRSTMAFSRVRGTCPAYYLCGLYASSDSCRTIATLCALRSPHCSLYEHEDIWQSQFSLCCSYKLEQFTF